MQTSVIIEFPIKPSKYQSIFFNILHLFAGVAIIQLEVPVLIQVLLGLLLVLHFSIYRRKYFVSVKTSILRYSETAGWQLENQATLETIEILPTTFISPWLIIIHYCYPSSNRIVYSIVCFKDALSRKNFKRLIVQLKITGLATRTVKA
jgi:hypothetical protein